MNFKNQGKTTCAHLYGRLLKELSILSNGDVVMASSSDFVGAVVGESQKKTNEMLEKARGKVLVIDEAYNLDDKLYGKQVKTTYLFWTFLKDTTLSAEVYL